MEGLPDYLADGMKILFIGYNPGIRSAELGHHYAGKGNVFFPMLVRSGLVAKDVTPQEDCKLLSRYGYGFTNLVPRPTRGIKDLNSEDYRKGRNVLREKLLRFRPQIAAYVGIGVYQHFTGRAKAGHGLQTPSFIEGVLDFVLPSTSGLNAIPLTEKERWFKELEIIIKATDNN
ncbi:MAG TPA: mismatch-specific DNA-glycosylase [Bacillota bacterium]|nr:mismatch-specific DNA-glycosylase [Bacillota bacterium]